MNNWILNVEQAGLTDIEKKGLAYFTACIPTVLAHVNQSPKILDALSPLLTEEHESNLHIKGVKSEFKAYLIYREFFYNACSWDINKSATDMTPPTLPTKYQEILDKKGMTYIDMDNNHYEKFGVWSSDTQYYKQLMCMLLLRRIGTVLNNSECSIEECFDLGHVHSNYWINSHEGETFCKSIISSNILPTYIATIIESLPFPNNFRSNPEIWILSKEISWRLQECQIYNFTEKNSEWIWLLHNYIFYTNDPNKATPKLKYKNMEGFNEMLSDVFLNIHNFNNSCPIDAYDLSFNNKYKSREDWPSFIDGINDKTNRFYGPSDLEKHNCQGEFYSYASFRFVIAASMYFDI